MLCPWPNIVLNQFAAQPYVDVVHSTSHGSSLIYKFSENSLHSSVHESVDEFPQTALLVSSATLQLRGWIPPAPPASATCSPAARPRHPVGYRSRAVAAVQAQGSTNGSISRSTSGSPGSKLKSSRPPDARGVLERNTRDSRSASGSPYLYVLGDQAGQCMCFIQSTSLPRDSWRALCSLTDQVLELPLCQHGGAPLHLHQRCARQSCFEELKRIIVVESHELSVLVSPHLSVVLTALSSSSAIDFLCWTTAPGTPEPSPRHPRLRGLRWNES